MKSAIYLITLTVFFLIAIPNAFAVLHECASQLTVAKSVSFSWEDGGLEIKLTVQKLIRKQVLLHLENVMHGRGYNLRLLVNGAPYDGVSQVGPEQSTSIRIVGDLNDLKELLHNPGLMPPIDPKIFAEALAHAPETWSESGLERVTSQGEGAKTSPYFIRFPLSGGNGRRAEFIELVRSVSNSVGVISTVEQGQRSLVFQDGTDALKIEGAKENVDKFLTIMTQTNNPEINSQFASALRRFREQF